MQYYSINKPAGKKGFTLVELLVVIAIIGILASVVMASLNNARAKGRDTKRVSDIKQLQLGLEFYYDANSNEYPDSLADLAPLYIPSVPKDPSTEEEYAYTSDGDTYTLAAQLEGPNDALNEDIDSGSVGGIDCEDNEEGESGFCLGP